MSVRTTFAWLQILYPFLVSFSSNLSKQPNDGKRFLSAHFYTVLQPGVCLKLGHPACQLWPCTQNGTADYNRNKIQTAWVHGLTVNIVTSQCEERSANSIEENVSVFIVPWPHHQRSAPGRPSRCLCLGYWGVQPEVFATKPTVIAAERETVVAELGVVATRAVVLAIWSPQSL